MGKKKSAKIAKAPDYTALGDKTYAANKQNALDVLGANRANQTNQFGSVKWDRDPVSGAWTQTESYNPEQQALLDTQIGNQKRMGAMSGQLLDTADLDYSGAPKAGVVGGFNQQATDLMNQLRAPELQRARASKEAQLAAMGVGTGTGRAWDAEQANIGTRENEANLQSALAGIQQGNTMFDQQNQLRQNYIGEQDQMLQSAGGMMSGAAPEDLQFGSYTQMEGTNAPDYAALGEMQRKAKQDANNAKAAQSKGMLGGFGTAIGTGVGAMFGAPQVGAAVGGALDS